MAGHDQRSAVRRQRRDQRRRTTRGPGCWSARRAAAAAARVGQQQRGQRGAEPLTARQRRRPAGRPPRPGTGTGPAAPGPLAARRRAPGGRRSRPPWRRRRARRAAAAAAQRHVGTAPPGRGRSSPAIVCSSVVLPAPFGPTSAIRSGPRTSSSTAAPERSTSPSVVSTTRPRGTAVPGRSTRISRSSRSRASAPLSRSCAPLEPVVVRAAVLRPPTSPPGSACSRRAPCRARALPRPSSRTAGAGRAPARPRCRSWRWRRTSDRAARTACSAASCSAVTCASYDDQPPPYQRTAPSRRSPIRSIRSSSSRSWLTTSSGRPSRPTHVVEPPAGARSRLLVGSSSSSTSGRRSSSRASPSCTPRRRTARRGGGRARRAGSPSRRQLGDGPLLDVPVVADGRRSARRGSSVARLDGAQRPRRTAAMPRTSSTGAAGVEGEVLRQVADLAGDAHGARRSGAARRRSAAAAWTCRSR